MWTATPLTIGAWLSSICSMLLRHASLNWQAGAEPVELSIPSIIKRAHVCCWMLRYLELVGPQSFNEQTLSAACFRQWDGSFLASNTRPAYVLKVGFRRTADLGRLNDGCRLVTAG